MNAADATPFSIRRWTDARRLDEVVAVVHESFGSLAIDPPSGALRESAADFAARLRNESVLVAEGEGRVLGCVCCVPRADALYIGRLAVTRNGRGRGVGRALMAAAEADARGRGLLRLTLRVRIALPDNVAYFRKSGFIVIAEGCHPGYARPTFYDMERILDGRASA